ncbi:hypothetical protein [Planotetraspora sp. GP83]|uniref:hypothetical protein n=1 Tax=Planotetraspora sp. GP83 TaxID=3156264 RepID=UPI00351276C3
MRIGVTGHTNITNDTQRLVFDALCDLLREQVDEQLVGVSCIARGADSVFAEAVLSVGGALEVVLPSQDYREAKVKPDHADQFDALIARASQVRVMNHPYANRDAYESANEAVLGSVDKLVAVWDGQPGGRSGTADVVAEARRRGLPITVVWPDGACREA